MSNPIDDSLEEQQEITRSYTQVVERMSHLFDGAVEALDFMNVGSSMGFAGFEDLALSIY
jgi:hypothetical protein